MPKLDQSHDQVVRAFQKGGWHVDGTPARISTPYRTIIVDLQVSRGLNGNREQIFLIEVKCFGEPKSAAHDLYAAIGQYLIYRAMLVEKRRQIPIFLSIPKTIFEDIFDAAVMRVITESQIKLVIVELETETIERWIE